MYKIKLRNMVAIMTFLAVFSIGSAGAQTFAKGDNVVSAAIGFGGYYSGAFYSEGSRLPVLSLYYERAIVDNLWDEKSSIGLGGMLGYTSYNWSGYYKVSNTVIGVRGALHYQFIDKLDTYTGLFLGYDVVSWKYNNSWSGAKGSAASAFDYSWFLGTRYYFSDAFAVFGELGVGLAPLNVGVTLKF